MNTNNFAEQIFYVSKETEAHTLAQELDQRFRHASFLLGEVVKKVYEVNIAAEDSHYFEVLVDLLYDIKVLFRKIYLSGEGCQERGNNSVYVLNSNIDRSNCYYALCERVYQIKSIINILLDTSYIEQVPEDHYYLIKAVKNEFIRVSELLELSMIKIPGFYTEGNSGDMKSQNYQL